MDDPREEQVPASGWIEFEDAESGERMLVDTGDAELRKRWTGLATAAREARAQKLLQAGADHIALETEGDYALILRRAFARRLRHRRGAR